MKLSFRPHHFLCALGFEGHGYSDQFTANMAHIVIDTLRTPGGDDIEIIVTDATDDICTPCPKRRGTSCTSQDKITRLDRAHATALALHPGDQITWGEAQNRMAALPPDIHDHICKGCDWQALGLCAKALHRLQTS